MPTGQPTIRKIHGPRVELYNASEHQSDAKKLHLGVSLRHRLRPRDHRFEDEDAAALRRSDSPSARPGSRRRRSASPLQRSTSGSGRTTPSLRDVVSSAVTDRFRQVLSLVCCFLGAAVVMWLCGEGRGQVLSPTDVSCVTFFKSTAFWRATGLVQLRWCCFVFVYVCGPLVYYG